MHSGPMAKRSISEISWIAITDSHCGCAVVAPPYGWILTASVNYTLAAPLHPTKLCLSSQASPTSGACRMGNLTDRSDTLLAWRDLTLTRPPTQCKLTLAPSSLLRSLFITANCTSVARVNQISLWCTPDRSVRDVQTKTRKDFKSNLITTSRKEVTNC